MFAEGKASDATLSQPCVADPVALCPDRLQDTELPVATPV